MAPDKQTNTRPSPPQLDAHDQPTHVHARLELRNISKHFGGVAALTDISLRVNPGEVVAIAGNNGAGKSTLLRVIAGIHRPDSGVVNVSGETVRLRGPWEARALGIEHVPQELALAQHLTVAANMFLGREIVWKLGPFKVLDKKKMKEKAKELLTQFGINIPNPEARVFDMSGGQQQGVAIGRAVAWGSKVIILDEPTAALGVNETNHVENTIMTLRASNVGVILVSHDIDQIFRISDRIYVLRHGNLVGELDTKTATPHDAVSLITGVDKGI